MSITATHLVQSALGFNPHHKTLSASRVIPRFSAHKHTKDLELDLLDLTEFLPFHLRKGLQSSITTNGKPYDYIKVSLPNYLMTASGQESPYSDKLHQELAAFVRRVEGFVKKQPAYGGVQVRSKNLEQLVPFVQQGYQLETSPQHKLRNLRTHTLLDLARQIYETNHPKPQTVVKAFLLGINPYGNLSEQLPSHHHYTYEAVLFKPNPQFKAPVKA